MEFLEIIGALEAEGRFPFAAIDAARQDKEALAPRFIAFVESYIAGNAGARSKPGAAMMIFHLLGEWRAHAAYEPFARFLRLPADDLETCFGDSITETVLRVMASVYDGNPIPLQQIILDPDADEYVRSAMCETLAIVTREGQIVREDTVKFLERCFSDISPQGTCFVWHGCADAIAVLQIHELKPMVKIVCDREYIDMTWSDYEDFENEFARFAKTGNELDARLMPFDDIEEIAGWYCFSEEFFQKRHQSVDDDDAVFADELYPDKPAETLFAASGVMIHARVGAAKNSKNAVFPLRTTANDR